MVSRNYPALSQGIRMIGHLGRERIPWTSLHGLSYKKGEMGNETEIIAYIDAKLEGIRSFCCDCTEGCRKCEWRGFYVEEIDTVAG